MNSLPCGASWTFQGAPQCLFIRAIRIDGSRPRQAAEPPAQAASPFSPPLENRDGRSGIPQRGMSSSLRTIEVVLRRVRHLCQLIDSSPGVSGSQTAGRVQALNELHVLEHARPVRLPLERQPRDRIRIGRALVEQLAEAVRALSLLLD